MEQPVRIAFIGSRDFNNVALIEEEVIRWRAIYGRRLWIVSGGAPGADSLAVKAAQGEEVIYHVFPAQWKHLGHRGAGPVRNIEIEANADRVVAFHTDVYAIRPDGKESGTQNCINLFQGSRKPITEWDEGTKTWFTSNDGYKTMRYSHINPLGKDLAL